jgi:hypothetical protein|tara:strand:+ start:156 stop:311 length:156 start_codon:yes stop_codon:yes gene_type:complete
MLSENQVRRLLKQSENVYKTESKNTTKGWIQALRLVLEEDTYPIRKDPIDV